jgi:hypothetical protein
VDTRNKIIGFEAALRAVRAENLRVLTGRFDPLTSEHASRLQEFAKGGLVLVFVLDYEGSLLPAAARAELMAALRGVRYVSIAEGAKLTEALQGLDSQEVAREEEADQERQERLVAQIRQRG